MKTILRLTLVLCVLLAGAFAWSADTAIEERARLVEAIMPPHLRDQMLYKIRHPGEFRAEEVAYARKLIEEAKTAAKQLRKRIRTGSGILEFPGLISRGFLRYSRADGKGNYHLEVSAAKEGRLGASDPTGFVVVFNDQGIVTVVADLDPACY